MKSRRLLRAIALAQRPRASGPVVRSAAAHHLGQVEPGHRRCRARDLDGFFFVGCASPSHQAAVLRTFFAQHSRQLPGIDVGDAGHSRVAKIRRQIEHLAPARRDARQIADYQSGGEDALRLDVFGIDAGVADVRTRQCDDLPGVGRIGEDFLVTGHRGVEHHLTGTRGFRTNGPAAEHSPVSEREDRGDVGGRHGVFPRS